MYPFLLLGLYIAKIVRVAKLRAYALIWNECLYIAKIVRVAKLRAYALIWNECLYIAKIVRVAKQFKSNTL